MSALAGVRGTNPHTCLILVGIRGEDEAKQLPLCPLGYTPDTRVIERSGGKWFLLVTALE